MEASPHKINISTISKYTVQSSAEIGWKREAGKSWPNYVIPTPNHLETAAKVSLDNSGQRIAFGSFPAPQRGGEAGERRWQWRPRLSDGFWGQRLASELR